MKRLFVLSIKLFPIIQMIGMLVNSINYCFIGSIAITDILDFSIGNSLITTFLLYVCSYTFGFCKWHRLLITANLINISISTIDSLFTLPINNFNLLVIYNIIWSIFIILALYNKFVYKNEKCK